mgnify:CR=1 FL=1
MGANALASTVSSAIERLGLTYEEVGGIVRRHAVQEVDQDVRVEALGDLGLDRVVDLGQDGVIDKREFSRVLGQLRVGEGPVNEVFAFVDADRTGTISANIIWKATYTVSGIVCA